MKPPPCRRTLEARLEELADLLAASLDVDTYQDVEQLKEAWEPPPFDPQGLHYPVDGSDPTDYQVAELSALRRLLPNATARI